MCDLSVQVYFEVTWKSLSLSVSLSLMLTLYKVIYDLCLRVNKLHVAKLPSGYIRRWWRCTCGFTDTNNLSSACKHPHANCFFNFYLLRLVSRHQSPRAEAESTRPQLCNVQISISGSVSRSRRTDTTQSRQPLKSCDCVLHITSLFVRGHYSSGFDLFWYKEYWINSTRSCVSSSTSHLYS